MAQWFVKVYWKSIFVIAVPLLLLPLILLFPDSKEARAGYGVLLMALYWVSEVVPLAVTSIIPVFIFPLLGVLSTEDVCMNYMRSVNMMFIGGLIVAIAIEHCNLHKRIALRAMMFIGTSPNTLMLGFMLPTMFLSMWISNTATTAMMVPIVSAVLDELQAHENADMIRHPSVGIIGEAISEQEEGNFDQETRRKSVATVDTRNLPPANRTTICYYLSIAYAANIGGCGTLTGTATNLTFKGLYESLFPRLQGKVNFASWMFFNVPLMLVETALAWLWLLFYMGAFRRTKKSKPALEKSSVSEVIEAKYRELGPMTAHEVLVAILFVTLVLLWFFRQPEFIPGWGQLVSSIQIKDATPAMLIVLLLFTMPQNLDFFRRIKPGDDRKPAPALVNWKLIHEKMPWGLVLLIGGGMAMASASRESGLSHIIGEKLVLLKGAMPPYLIVIVLCFATLILTEISSNTAIANIILPVLAEMAVGMKIHPLYFMMPATLTCSYAFMLPVATPPNAIVQAASNMPTIEMVKSGCVMNILCTLAMLVLFPTAGVAIYDLYEFPPEAEHFNLGQSGIV